MSEIGDGKRNENCWKMFDFRGWERKQFSKTNCSFTQSTYKYYLPFYMGYLAFIAWFLEGKYSFFDVSFFLRISHKSIFFLFYVQSTWIFKEWKWKWLGVERWISMMTDLVTTPLQWNWSNWELNIFGERWWDSHAPYARELNRHSSGKKCAALYTFN